MFVYISIAMAQTKEELERAVRPGFYYEVNDATDMKSLLGQQLVDTFRLYEITDAGVTNDMLPDEDGVHRVITNTKFAHLREFARRNFKAAEDQGIQFTYLRIDCGKDYHDLVTEIERQKLVFQGDRVRFVKADLDGVSCNAVPVLSNESLSVPESPSADEEVVVQG